MTASLWAAYGLLAIPVLIMLALPPERVNTRLYVSMFCLVIAGGVSLIDALWRPL